MPTISILKSIMDQTVFIIPFLQLLGRRLTEVEGLDEGRLERRDSWCCSPRSPVFGVRAARGGWVRRGGIRATYVPRWHQGLDRGGTPALLSTAFVRAGPAVAGVWRALFSRPAVFLEAAWSTSGPALDPSFFQTRGERALTGDAPAANSHGRAYDESGQRLDVHERPLRRRACQ